MAENDIVVFKVIRKPPLGKLAVEVNSVKYESLSEIQAANVKQMVMAAIGDLIVFVDGYDTLVDAGMAPPAASSTPGTQQLLASMSERQAAFRSSVQRLRDEAALAEQAKPEPMQKEPPPKLDDGPDVEINLIETIDALFQKYIAADPSLRGRSAGLESAPGGGLRIRVDYAYYDQPKQIEDVQVRRALMLALKEWESGEEAR